MCVNSINLLQIYYKLAESYGLSFHHTSEKFATYLTKKKITIWTLFQNEKKSPISIFEGPKTKNMYG